MRFETNLYAGEKQHYIELPQIPIPFISTATTEDILIEGFYYRVHKILYRDGGTIDLILYCHNYSDNKAINKINITATIKVDNLIYFTDTINNISGEIGRLPQTNSEYIEVNGIVYRAIYTILKEDGTNQLTLSAPDCLLSDFYPL